MNRQLEELNAKHVEDLDHLRHLEVEKGKEIDLTERIARIQTTLVLKAVAREVQS